MRSLRLMGTHGILPEERLRAQPFELDLDIYLAGDPETMDLGPPGSTAECHVDDLTRTVDYAVVVQAAAAVMAGEPCNLIETLAEKVAGSVLAIDGVGCVTVALRKLRPPVEADLGSAGVRITRSSPSPIPHSMAVESRAADGRPAR
ncbi:MAG: dihydroneopterin aldolase [Acidimicrobiales bacterium]